MTKKQIRKNKVRYALDTSCQIEKIKGRKKWLVNLKSSGNNVFFSPHYSLYELKYGLINDWINFYYFIEVNGIQDAFNEWSDRYGRGSKYVAILQGLVLNDLDRNPITNPKTYLRSVEGAIYTALSIFEWNLEGFFGEFSDNELVVYPLESSEDFEDFSEVVKRNKFVSFGKFIEDNMANFQALRDGLKATESTLEERHKKIISVLEEVISDTKRANMHNNSKALADSVITIQVPEKWHLISKDEFHSVSSTILSKKFVSLKDLQK
jgi:hypothetical protein